MNIFYKVALQGLKRNRTRTLVTIAGVALSAALITGVATFAVSLLNYMVNGASTNYGKWHVGFLEEDGSFLQEQIESDKAVDVGYYENIGYAKLLGGQNPDKPYLFLTAFNKATFDTLPVHLLTGRLPQNSGEVVISSHIAANGGVQFSVGDSLSLVVGSRQAGEDTLNQHDPYRMDEESLVPVGEKTYTVVGVCQRPSFEERSAPGYTVITVADDDRSKKAEDHKAIGTGEEARSSLGVFVTLREPYRLYSYLKGIGENHDYMLNDNVLRFLGLSGDRIMNTMLFSVAGVLVILVMLGSVFMIYNSFQISMNERMQQFGILMSIGATEKQLKNSVLFEGVCIGVIGIPMGIFIGIPSIKLVLSLVEKNFANLLYDSVPLALKISAPALAAVVIISLITILISAYIPAKKAVGTPPMVCIRQTGEIKVEPGMLKTPKFGRRTRRLEWELALKNFKRNRRRYRTVILSLVLSVVLFVSASAFRIDLEQAVGENSVPVFYDIAFGTHEMEDSEMLSLYEKLKTVSGVSESMYQEVAVCSCKVNVNDLSDAFREIMKIDSTEETVTLSMRLQFVDDGTYQNIVRDAGLPEEEYKIADARLIGTAKIEDSRGKEEENGKAADMFSKIMLNASVLFGTDSRSKTEGGEMANLTFIESALPDLPPTTEDLGQQEYCFYMAAPWSWKENLVSSSSLADVIVKGMTFRSENPGQSAAQMKRIIEGEGITSSYTLYNVYAMLEENRNLLFIVNLFTAVFIVMISLIAVANVFNTISTNIRLRRRELAMLRSVGMSERNFSRMMCYECVFYGWRTLLYGIPTAGVLAVLIYLLISGGSQDEVRFVFPWASMGIGVLGVFFVIFITMLYATNKIKKENIIDALRDDMT